MPKRIVLDAGHGGKDSGAVGHGLYEKNLNLAMALACRSYLLDTYKDVEVKMTRETDVFLELKERTDLANSWGADVFLSFHINANPNPAPNGFETYIYNSFANTAARERTERFQFSIHKAAAPRSQMNDRGMKAANFYVLRETNMPACLGEAGFISSPIDAALMKAPSWAQNMGIGYAIGLATFLGLQTKTEAAPAQDPAVKWAVEKGIIKNENLGGAVTREELVKILHAYDSKR